MSVVHLRERFDYYVLWVSVLLMADRSVDEDASGGGDTQSTSFLKHQV